MRKLHPFRRTRRGLTLVEVLISCSLMLGIVYVLTAIGRLQSLFWQQGMAATGSQLSAQLALQRLAPTVRGARRVIVDQSSATKLTVQMPAYDGGGNLVIPMVDGQKITYYLSDLTGGTVNNGTVLWRSVNGAPDAAWSKSGTKGRVTLGAGGLSFIYYPPSDPETVIVAVTASKTSGTRTDTFPTTQEILLRNKGL